MAVLQNVVPSKETKKMKSYVKKKCKVLLILILKGNLFQKIWSL